MSKETTTTDLQHPDQERIRIGKNIRERRIALGITQTELAAKCGLLQSRIAHVENGDNSTGLDILSRIADALNCEIALISKISKKK